MTPLDRLVAALRASPLVASAQTERGSPLDSPLMLGALAECSLQQGAQVLRLEGVETIRQVRQQSDALIIGLIKDDIDGFAVRITPTLAHVERLLESGCDVIAFDATFRARPDGSTPHDLIRAIQLAGKIALADIDSVATLDLLLERPDAVPELVSTTLSGYTPESGLVSLDAAPDFDLVEACVRRGVLTLAEGRFAAEHQVRRAMALGAVGVVVGGALNDPLKQTRRFLQAASLPQRIGAFDLGGTWMRFRGLDRAEGTQVNERALTPGEPAARLVWMRSQLAQFPVERVGVSSGGVIDPSSGSVVSANVLMPGHTSLQFNEATLGLPTLALNDGLTTALAHAKTTQGRKGITFTLALGTGLGCGVSYDGRLLMPKSGEYPRWNERICPDSRTFEQALGGAYAQNELSEAELRQRVNLLDELVNQIRKIHTPDQIFLAGSMGLLLEPLLKQPVLRSPFGADAGLEGALLLALEGI